MLNECLEALNIKPDGIYVDCTTGGAGHSSAILKLLGKDGLLICLDKDDEALKYAEERLEKVESLGRYVLIKSDFSQIDKCLENKGIERVDGILADFGVSSHQLDENKRGFGYMLDGPLDMRMDAKAELTAEYIINKYSESELERILFEYGEERYTRRIVSSIIRERALKEIKTTKQLADLIIGAIPRSGRQEKQHPAKRSFQAIRIEVNKELDAIKILLEKMPDLLNTKGRFAAISFHSLEDRLVKEALRNLENPCKCPKDFPMCVCGKKPLGKAINRKPIAATLEEIDENPRSRSAKLRVFEKISI